LSLMHCFLLKIYLEYHLSNEVVEVEGVDEKEMPQKQTHLEDEYHIENRNTPSIENKRNVRNKKNNKNNQITKTKTEPTIKDDILFYCHTIKYNK